jgi:hypothetical protein
MQPEPKNQFQPLIESVENIVSAMKMKERYIEELNTGGFSNASENVRNKLLIFESLFQSMKEPDNFQNTSRLTESQKQIFEKVIEDANLGIESHNLKVVRDSIRDLESFRLRITDS